MSKLAVKDVYTEQARQVFLSAGINANENEIEKVKEFLKNSDRWVAAQISLARIMVNTRDKELLLKAIDAINRLETESKIKGEILKGIADLSEDKNKNEIHAALYYIQSEEGNKLITNYPSVCGLDEVVFRLGRLGIRKSKKEVNGVMNILNEKETIDAIRQLTERYEGSEQKKLAAGEVIHLISNSEVKDFMELRKNLSEIIPEMKREYNITHFGRYSARFLSQLYEYAKSGEAGEGKIGEGNRKEKNTGETGKKEKKQERIFIFAYSYSDHNGAFYSDSKHTDALSSHGKVLAVEAGSDVELLLMLEKMNKKHGSFNGVFIAGHGEPTRVKLGKEEAPYSLLDVTDYDIMSRIGDLIDREDKGSFIALISCSTGNEQSTRSLANIMASAAKVSYVYAPDDSFTKYTLNIESEKKNASQKKAKRKDERITVAYQREKGTVQTMEFGIKK